MIHKNRRPIAPAPKGTWTFDKVINYFEKGSGEVFAFICMAPTVLMLLIMLTGVVQVSSMKQKLEYTTYVACRAACVSTSMEKAKKAAETVAKEDLLGYADIVDVNSVQVKLSLVKGQKWEKGSYVKCTVSVKTNAAGGLFKMKKTFSLVMAIEIPEGLPKNQDNT